MAAKKTAAKKTAAKKTSKRASKSGTRKVARPQRRLRVVEGPVAAPPARPHGHACRCRDCGTTGATGPSGLRGSSGPTGATGPASRDVGKNPDAVRRSRTTTFDLPSGRRAWYELITDRREGVVEAGQLRAALREADSRVFASAFASVIGGLVKLEFDAGILGSLAPVDLAEVLGEVATTLGAIAPAGGKLALVAEHCGTSAATLRAEVAPTASGFADLVELPAIVERASVALKASGDSFLDGRRLFVVVKDAVSRYQAGLHFSIEEAHKLCAAAGDVHEFSHDGDDWIVAVPRRA